MTPTILNVGNACIDVVHYIDQLPNDDSKITSKLVEIKIGGNAANSAAAISDLGGNAKLCTVLGSRTDVLTQILISKLKEKHVSTEYCRLDNDLVCPSSVIMVLPNGNRSIMHYQSDLLRSRISRPQLDDVDLVMADSYRLPMVSDIFAEAHSRHIPTMIDIDEPIDQLSDMPKADYVWFSYEAWKNSDISIATLQNYFGGIVGITNGANDIIWTDHSLNLRSFTPRPVVAVNTLGAGDVWRARLGLELCMCKPVATAVELACETAAEHITNKALTKVLF